MVQYHGYEIYKMNDPETYMIYMKELLLVFGLST